MDAPVRKDVDSELVERCRGGEEAAQRELFRVTREDVRRILLRLLGPTDQLDDLIQNVYLALYKSLANFRGECSFRTWLYGICIRVAHKYRRTTFRWRRLGEQLASFGIQEGNDSWEEEKKERAALVWKTLERLSLKHREILVLFEMEEIDGRELARLLRIPEGTVWTRLHHARRAFQRAWRQLGGK